MTKRVMICAPESCLDDPYFQAELDYDQKEGRLIYEGSTLVQIDGETINFPRAWIKHLSNT